jgi:hypothetical protein
MKTPREKNAAVAKAFIMFLKANNAFIGYKRATQGKNNGATFWYYFKNLENDDIKMSTKWRGFIFSAFMWAGTVECREDPLYWSRLHTMCVGILEQVIHNDYEISKDISRAILAMSNKR